MSKRGRERGEEEGEESGGEEGGGDGEEGYMQFLNSSFLCDVCRHFQDFFFSHFTLIDAHLEQLKEGVEDACHNRGSFTATVVKVTQDGKGPLEKLSKCVLLL